eukprot:6393053-Alexandrium_andersonii.AAC.1
MMWSASTRALVRGLAWHMGRSRGAHAQQSKRRHAPLANLGHGGLSAPRLAQPPETTPGISSPRGQVLERKGPPGHPARSMPPPPPDNAPN